MLERLAPQPPDALLALIKLYADDPREEKIDLGVGVYRTADGRTPVFKAIKEAERRLLEQQQTKAYLGPEGDIGFVDALAPIIFGDDRALNARLCGMQTPGGTGAVRLALGLARRAGVQRVLIGTPSWPNHGQILADLGLEAVAFDHADIDGAPNLDALFDAIGAAQPGDAVLLHGSSHNPTGIDYSLAQWEAIAQSMADAQLLPIIDCAYQGLGRSLEEDVEGMRSLVARSSEALIAYSCDKNFGLYRDRVGAFYMVAPEADALATIQSNANALARASWSMPPDHGAAAVRIVLEDEALTRLWLDELESMRKRLREVRERLGSAGVVGRVDLRPLAQQNGLFAVLAVSAEEVRELREKHAVYMAASGRINIAGLHEGNIDRFLSALGAVTAP